MGGGPGRDTAADKRVGKGPGSPDYPMSMDGVQVVNRHCTICDWEAQLVERGLGEDPLCPWCYGPTERTSIVGLVIPESVRPGQKNPYSVVARPARRAQGRPGSRRQAQRQAAARHRHQSRQGPLGHEEEESRGRARETGQEEIPQRALIRVEARF